MKDNNQNKVFLKEESLLISKINDYYKAKEYDKIATLRNDVFKSLDLFKKTDTIFQIVSSLFLGKYFSYCICFVEELLKHEIEDMKYSFYMLASLISVNDIDMAKNYLKRSKILNSNYVKSIILEDGANYASIKNAEDIDDIPCLLLVNYVYEFEKEGKDNIKDYNIEDIRIYKYFELIDDIYEAHYDMEIVDFMTNIARIMFER